MSREVGCLVLFLLPFASVGIFTAMQAVRSALAHDWGQAGFFSIFALTFGGVGIGGIIGALKGKRRLEAQEALRAAHADTPWLWRSDWAAGRADDATRQTAWFALGFAAFWNLISFPAGFLAVREAVQKGNHAALIALLFPLIGSGLLVWAVRSVLRLRRYGVSRFELSTLPGVIGHTLSGTVRISEVLRPEGGFLVTLCCLRRYVTGSGKNRSTSETIFWQEERRIQGVGATLPVAFAIPADARATDDRNANDRILWRLTVTADVPGVDYAAAFEVPVFRTVASDQPRTEAEVSATRDPLAPAVYRQPATSRIEVTTNRRGTEILFPAARNPGMAGGVTAFFAVWSVAIWAVIHFKAPIIFPIVFGFFGMLILWGVLDLWLKVTRVTVDSSAVTVANGYLISGAGKTIAANDVEDVTAAIAGQGGSTVYYSVQLVLKNGKKVNAGSWLRDKHEAEWLAVTIKTALGR
jgi:hypothetical protein